MIDTKSALAVVCGMKARVEDATPGPWRAWDRTNPHYPPYDLVIDENGDVVADTSNNSDTVFIAEARSDIPVLIDLVEQLVSELEDTRLRYSNALSEWSRLKDDYAEVSGELEVLKRNHGVR